MMLLNWEKSLIYLKKKKKSIEKKATVNAEILQILIKFCYIKVNYQITKEFETLSMFLHTK